MILENEYDHCTSYTSKRLTKTQIWRESLAVRYPHDRRNRLAAESLAELATDFANLPYSDWVELKQYYKWDCQVWQEAVSITARRIGFQYGRTLPIFVMNLVGALSIHSRVAA